MSSHSSFAFSSRAAYVFLLLFASRLAPGQEVPTRALPLNHFPVSRDAVKATAGFYFMPAGVADDYFDGSSPVSRLQRHFRAARRVHARYLRCAFSWNGIEPKRGELHWQFWDTLVKMAEQNHVELIPYVAYTPRWAARDQKEFWKQPPSNPQLYADFMFQIVSRYRGRIRSWEIWNEPDNKDYWTGTPEEYAELTMLASKSIRQADPHAVLVLGGIAYGPSRFFQTLIQACHLDRYVDIVALHAYPESWLNERMETVFQRWVPDVVRLLSADASGDALWLNEMGYPDYRFRPNQASIYGSSVNYRYEHTRTYQAAMLFKMEVMALASGAISLTAWYRIDDFPLSEKRLGSDQVNYHLGLETTTGSPKPAFRALAFFNRLFQQPIRQLDVKTSADSNAVVRAFQRNDGKIILVGWLRSSLPEEVADKSGMAEDKRSETISADLPCHSARLLGFYDQEGRRLGAGARVQGDVLQNVRLLGDQVFVAQMACGAARH